MNIQDLGAIGEFLGFLAVLVTLFYIAVQTRQNVKINEAKEQRALIDQLNHYFRVMIQPDNLQAVRRALQSYRRLDSDDQARSCVLLAQWVNHFEQARYSHQAGLLPAPVLIAFQNFTLGFLVTPGGKEFWEDMKNVFGSDVRDCIDSLLADEANHPPKITDTYAWLSNS